MEQIINNKLNRISAFFVSIQLDEKLFGSNIDMSAKIDINSKIMYAIYVINDVIKLNKTIFDSPTSAIVTDMSFFKQDETTNLYYINIFYDDATYYSKQINYIFNSINDIISHLSENSCDISKIKFKNTSKDIHMPSINFRIKKPASAKKAVSKKEPVLPKRNSKQRSVSDSDSEATVLTTVVQEYTDSE